MKLVDQVVDKTFETKVDWGIDLAEEHERYNYNVSNLMSMCFSDPPIIFS